MSSLEFSQLFRAALSIVKQDIGQLVDRDAVALVQDVLRIAGSAGSVFVAGLAKRVSRHTDASVEFVARVAASAGTIVSVVVAVVVHGNADLVGIEEPSVRTLQAHLVVPVPGSTAEVSRASVVEIRE